MEMQKEKAAPVQESEAQSLFTKFVAEKEPCMETKNEMALLRLGLESWNHITSQNLQIQLLFQLGVCERARLQGNIG